jgi:NADPH:quinone reductase-like Zn-dependent oxidoreductase
MAPWIALTSKKRVRVVFLKTNKDLAYLAELFEAGKLKPVLDGPYRLSETPDAMRHFGDGGHKGKVVISIPEAVLAGHGDREPASHGVSR